MDYTQTLTTVGDKFSSSMTWITQKIASLGLSLSSVQSKILNLIVLLTLAFVIAKTIQKPIKWVLVALIIILSASIAITLI